MLTPRNVKTHVIPAHGNLRVIEDINQKIAITALGNSADKHPVRYQVEIEDKSSVIIPFHHGKPADGLTGITNEVLLAIVLDRLSSFQTDPVSACAENDEVIVLLNTALKALMRRTKRMQHIDKVVGRVSLRNDRVMFCNRCVNRSSYLAENPNAWTVLDAVLTAVTVKGDAYLTTEELELLATLPTNETTVVAYRQFLAKWSPPTAKDEL